MILLCGFVTTSDSFHIIYSNLFHCQYKNLDQCSVKIFLVESGCLGVVKRHSGKANKEGRLRDIHTLKKISTPQADIKLSEDYFFL